MMEAVLSLKDPCTWLTVVTSEFDVRIRVLDCIPDGDRMRDLAEIDLNRGDLDAIVECIRAHGDVVGVEVEQVEKDRAWVVVTARNCTGCLLLKRHRCFLLQAETSGRSEITWKVVFTEKRHLQELVFALKEAGIEVRIMRISKFAEKESLTERQEQMIRQALALGYYDFPKRIGIRDLAAKFNVSTATLSETLRRGQKKIL
ncbi:MAG TPA: hypothetical protein EYP43_00920 [Thermoplasmata archaeon]|nr:hypothetical protein [Thermoplasmata archaeon]